VKLQAHAKVAQAHYTLLASFKVPFYISQTWPESLNNHLYLLVFVTVAAVNDNDYSAFALHWAV